MQTSAFSAETPPRHAPVLRKDGAPARILLAEDDYEMRDLVASALRKDGYDVVDIPDGGRLLVQIAESYLGGRPYDAYDLVISDVRMPVCSGLQILEGLRRARWTAPVILMTAFGDEQTRTRAHMLDAVLFDKPFDVDDLRTAVLNLLTEEPATHTKRPVSTRGAHEETPHPMTLVDVATYDQCDDAWIAKGRLERAGLRVYVAGPCTSGSVPKATRLVGDVTLFVLDSEADRARAILKSYAVRDTRS